jgi:hypothetical protein
MSRSLLVFPVGRSSVCIASCPYCAGVADALRQAGIVGLDVCEEEQERMLERGDQARINHDWSLPGFVRHRRCVRPFLLLPATRVDPELLALVTGL